MSCDHSVLGDDGVNGDADYRQLPRDPVIGINANQAVVANGGTVDGGAVCDGTVRPDNGGTIRDMDHREVLNIRERANFDVVRFGSHDHLWPHGDSLVQANVSIQFGTRACQIGPLAAGVLLSWHFPSLPRFAGSSLKVYWQRLSPAW